MKILHWAWWLSLTAASWGAEPPQGTIIDRVECQANTAQSYALYLPANYSAAKQWNVIFGFDPGGRGRRAVERYQAAAEKYGYIVAGSNNSRNGPWEISTQAAMAMMNDVTHRFSVNPKRIYTAGMSGGARVAMQVAFDFKTMAGVLASSAAFPGEFQTSVEFPVFGTAGTDDFNHLEMAELDSRLTTAHRVEYFDGGHMWLPLELAMDGVEWMELQAMKTGARPRDAKLIDEIFARREARALEAKPADSLRELRSIETDFQGLKDLTKVSQTAKTLEQRPDVKQASKVEAASQTNEVRVTTEVYQLRNNPASFNRLKELLLKLNEQGNAANDSAERRIARRVLGGFIASSRGSNRPEMQQLLNQLRPPRGDAAGR